jgi:hypothetical protein
MRRQTRRVSPGGFNYMPAKMVHEAWLPANSLTFITVDGPWDVNWVEGPPTAADLTKSGDWNVEGELPRAFCSRGCWPRLRSKPPVAQFYFGPGFNDSGLLAVLGRAAYTRKCPNTK